MNICGLIIIGGQTLENMKKMFKLHFKKIYILSSNVCCESSIMTLNCGGEFLLFLLLGIYTYNFLINASFMTSFAYVPILVSVNVQRRVCNSLTSCKMMCTTYKNWTLFKCFYFPNDNFDMCLLYNHGSFPFSDVSDTELLNLFFSIEKNHSCSTL